MKKDIDIFIQGGKKEFNELKIGDGISVRQNEKIKHYQLRGYGSNNKGKFSMTFTPSGELAKEDKQRNKIVKKLNLN